MTVSEAISLLGTFAALAMAVIAWRKAKPETRSLEADIAAKWQAQLTAAADRINAMQAQIDQLRKDRDDLKQEWQTTGEQLEELQSEMTEWRRGVGILLRQMKRAGMTPDWEPKETRASK